jgi:hypothetical protein
MPKLIERANLDTLILEDFRCFAGRHEVPLRPLTLLVGENSTGKTSFLAAVSIAQQNARFYRTPDFNQAPFSLGTFHEIVNSRRQRNGDTSEFSLGLGVKSHNGFHKFTRYHAIDTASFEFGYRGRDAQPELFEWKANLGESALVVSPSPDESRIEWITKNRRVHSARFPIGPNEPTHWFLDASFIARLFKIDKDERKVVTELARLNLGINPTFCFPFSPIRAEPQRHYEVISDAPTPQGDDVPIILSQIYGSEQWEQIKEPLQSFAKAAGLFDQLTVKRLGSSNGSPFQINVKIGTTPRNIVDVGYGVSQVLPIIFELAFREKHRVFMIQQPEVHLHPRAQAELGSFFGYFAAKRGKQLLVETHSDNLLDRVRMDVRDKKNLRPEDVVILFFDKGKDGVKIHPIFLDEHGNLIDAPDTYRRFFLLEERRYWGLP